MSRTGFMFAKALRAFVRRRYRGAVIPWATVLRMQRLAVRLTGEASPLLPPEDELTLAQQCIGDPRTRELLRGVTLTPWGMDVATLVWTARFMRRHRIRRVLEFGSGVSTLLFAACCRECDAAPGSVALRANGPLVLSVEQNEDYARQTRSMLAERDLGDVADVLFCPLEMREWKDMDLESYRFDAEATAHVPGDWRAELIFLDGPSTSTWGRLLAVTDGTRYAADECSLLMDDVFRAKDMAIAACVDQCGAWGMRGVAPVGKGLALGARTQAAKEGAAA